MMWQSTNLLHPLRFHLGGKLYIVGVGGMVELPDHLEPLIIRRRLPLRKLDYGISPNVPATAEQLAAVLQVEVEQLTIETLSEGVRSIHIADEIQPEPIAEAAPEPAPIKPGEAEAASLSCAKKTRKKPVKKNV